DAPDNGMAGRNVTPVSRVSKLKETLVTVHQLHRSMSSLQPWLSRVETVLTSPAEYGVCHRDEIRRRLAEQQELQTDIEQHTEGVSSVLALGDVLLHDEDACSSDSENDSIRVTMRSLDQRWRKICCWFKHHHCQVATVGPLFFKKCKFGSWLTHNTSERTASEPSSSDVLYAVAKEELKRYETLQREVYERLAQLESINYQYCQLARDNRLDAGKRLRTMVQRSNQQWDALQMRVAAILRRLKHFTAQREEFESTREHLMIWLTETDLQLSSVEHFSESDIHHKLEQLRKIITLKTNQIDALIVFGEGLIQRSCPLDAAVIEDELEQLHSYCQEVFGRAVRFHQRLTGPRPPLQEESELSGSESAAAAEAPEPAGPRPDAPGQGRVCLPPPLLERSGRETPVSVDSIPLEWDHTGDVGGSSSHEEDEDASFFDGTSGTGQSTHGSSTVRSRAAGSGRHCLLSECSGSIKSVKRVSLLLDEEEQQIQQGLTALGAVDKQPGVIERWELLQAREQRSSGHPQQLTSHLHDVTSWLGRVTPELETLLDAEVPVTLELLEDQVKHLKELQKAFAHYKTLMLSMNLGSREPQQEVTGEGLRRHDSLGGMNQAWATACASLEAWESRLRTSVLHCQVRPPGQLKELKSRQRQVVSLQELASELLPESGPEESSEAREKVHVIGSKLGRLLCQVKEDLRTVQDALSHTAVCCRAQRRAASPRRSFFCRVLRAAFPLHLLVFFLLVLACLVPLSEEDYSCTLTNNFARSFHPMLRYTNGPPPT
uniref:KASH domain-containing protein n=1 Tax=Electrophorus electricus TaxID=8005 RepID=A0A4W4EGC1_ELEEL